ncbi:FG-GAP-like repeat-containing protein (plasmid) [Kovacikia minuta CCNUW1]|uniref:FG-GAP-like repeat-containing protein n=1 Tax=Kovacikia minuta TaxID=2931930 RepID=UPI001CCA1BE8|nr:FG-GAP-like repeat-containing protein [Kovacikia minuta]UBF30105.1 FG-GAP-like repeat-containing protein [Kovacikia minuta CCNUW1]
MVGTGDFDGDLQTDILWRNGSTGQNVIWQMNGATLGIAISLPNVSGSTWSQAISDFNGDGQSDILWRNGSTGQNVIWLINGTSLNTAVSLPTLSGTAWTIAGIDDFNGDQKNDILWRNYSSGQTAIWLMNGTTYSTAANLGTKDTNWKIISSATQFDPPTAIDNAGNTTATAFNIGTLNGSGTYSGIISDTDANDYYKFSLLTEINSVHLQLSGFSGDANIQLLDSSNNVIQSSTNGGTLTEFIDSSLNAGTYYIRIYTGAAGVNTGYKFSLYSGSISLDEGNRFLTQTTIPIELGQSQGTRKLTFDLSAQFGTANSSTAIEDAFLVYLVNSTSQTLLDQGKGTAVFSLSGNNAEYTPGLVTYNGSKVEIDLSSLKDETSGTLIFQLINNDADTNAQVQVTNLTNTVDSLGVSSPVFSTPRTVLPGAAISNVSSFTTTTDLKALLSNVHRNPKTGKFVANLQVQNTGTTAIGRQVIALFANLPAGVALLNASGTNANNKPYLNLKPAISSGGLEPGTISDAVEISFDDPNLVQFNWQPSFLTGIANSAPVFSAIAPITIHPGESKSLSLATDADGDQVIYTLRVNGTQPPVSISGDGKLMINPNPNQLGNYTFTVVASDGALETTQDVQLTVAADSVTTTRVSGIIKNAGTTPQALQGIKVEWGSISTTTASDGSFTLEFANVSSTNPLPTTPLKVDGKQSGSYSDLTFDVSNLLGHNPYTAYNNVISQPIYLNALDTTHTTPISATGSTEVTNSTLAGTKLTVPAGTLQNAQGGAYTGQISLTSVNSSQLPVPLPDGLSSRGVIAVDLMTATCTGSLPLQVSNPTSYQGPLDLWGLTSDGTWKIVGAGYAGGDGLFTSSPFTLPGGTPPNGNTPTNGIPGGGYYFFAPKALTPKDLSAIPRNPDEVCESCKVRKQFNDDASVELYSGGVMESHELMTYQSLGETRGVQLQYNSLRADPRPIVHFGYDDVQYDSVNNDKYRMIAKLTVKLGDGSTYQVPGYEGHDYGLTGGENFWKLPTPTSGSTVDVDGALQVNLRNQASGIYDYDLTTGIKVLCNCPGEESYFYGASTTQHDQLVIVNSINSAFGSGWGLAGWQEIVESQSGSVLLIDGNGSQLVFKKVGSAYQSPEGDFSTLVKLANGQFQRTTKDGTVYTFNGQKKLETVADRNGLTTTYTYDSAGRLKSMVDPAGPQLETTFTYYNTGVNANRVRYITDPAGRVTEMVYDSNGNLFKVIDPDQKFRTWGYDSEHHITSNTDKLGNQGQAGHTDQGFYDFAGRATKAINKDGTVVKVSPAQVQGLYKPEETKNPFPAPVAFTTQPTEADYVDANGNVTRVRLDRAQQEIFSRDGLGTSTTFERTDTGANKKYLVTKSTDARGHSVSYTYDTKGNLVSMTDELSKGVQATDSLFPHPLYESPGQTVAKDWDGDGNLDLIGSNGASVNIVYGDGHGGFSTPTTLLPTGGHRLAIGDLNGDGRLDLVTGSFDGKTLSVHLQQSTGTFLQPTDLTITNSPGGEIVAIGLADLDGDQDLDLFSLNGAGYGNELDNTKNNLNVWVNNGQGGFGTTPLTTQLGNQRPVAISSGDVNGDNRLDFVVSSKTYTLSGNQIIVASQQVSVLLGQANAPFSIANTYTGGEGVQTALGDVNGDGKLDLAMLASDSTSISLLTGQGDGSFTALSGTPFSAPTGNLITSVFLKDVNGDGKLDLINTLTPGANNVAVSFGQGNSTLGAAQFYQLTGATDRLLFGDFTTQAEDPSLPGKLDLLIPTEGVSPNNGLLVNQGARTFVARPYADSRDFTVGNNPVVGSNPTAIATGDINGDSIPDVVTANAGTNTVSVGLGNGDGTFATIPDYAVGSSPQGVALGDLNGDGKLDFVTANYGNGTVSIGLGDGKGFFAAASSIAVGANPTSVSLGDLNGDDKLELVLTTSNQVSVLLNQTANGTLSFATRVDYGVGTTPKTAALGDINRDGKLDVVTANFGSGNLSVLLGAGNGTLGAATTYTVGTNPTSVALGDVNGDGKLDLVSTNASTDVSKNSISVLLGNGLGAFGTKTDYQVGYSPTAIGLGDFNNDGKLDVLTANSSTMSLLLGKGDGTFPAKNRFDFLTTGSPKAISLADLDLDGALDFVTANVGAAGAGSVSPRLNDLLRIGTPIGTGTHLYTYDPTFNQLTSETDELGRQTLYDIDSLTGNVKSMTRVVGTLDDPNAIVDDVVTRYTYTTDGRVETTMDSMGRVTRYNYSTNPTTVLLNGQQVQLLNPTGQLRSITFAEGTTDQATQWFGYDAAGNQTLMVDENGNRTVYSYDLNTNRLMGVTGADPDGSGPLAAPVTTYTYDANGNQLTVTDPNGNVTTNHYDNRGRLDWVMGADPDGQSGPLTAPVTTYQYDKNGNQIAVTDALGHVTKYSYDERDRLTETTNPDGKQTQSLYDFDNNPTGRIDASGHRANTVIDARGRRIRETDAAGNTTRFVYDPANQLIATVDAKGQMTHYVYDDLGRQIEVIDAQGHHTKTEYDRNGNVK